MTFIFANLVHVFAYPTMIPYYLEFRQENEDLNFNAFTYIESQTYNNSWGWTQNMTLTSDTSILDT